MDTTQSGGNPIRYIVYTWVPDALLAEWNTWHTSVHVPEVVATPYIQSARKYRVHDISLPGDWQPQYVTIYELASLDDFRAYVAGPGAALRADYEARYGAVGRIARLVLHEEARFDPV